MPSVFSAEVCGKSSDTAKELVGWLREGGYLKAKAGRDQFRLSLGAHNAIMVYYISGVVRNLKDDGTLHEEDQRSHAISAHDIGEQMAEEDSPSPPARSGKKVVRLKDARKDKPRLMGSREQSL